MEAELARLAGGSDASKSKTKPKPKLLPASDLDKMIADSLKDVEDEEDDDVEDDPDLMGELKDIAGDEIEEESVQEESAANNQPEEEAPQMFLPTSTVNTLDIIKARIEMYKLAETQAKAAGEAGKARRFGRGLKTLTDLLKQASAGKSINVDDIPPEVFVKNPNPAEDAPGVPLRKAPSPPSSTPANESPTEEAAQVEQPAAEPSQVTPTSPQTSEQAALIEELRERQKAYKLAALQHKRSGDNENAKQFLKVVKQFDIVIKMVEDGQQVDLSDMPPPPEEFLEFLAKMQAAASAEETAVPAATEVVTPVAPEPQEEAPTTATTMLEALQQRLAKYKSVEEAAKAEGNASKARRFGRIVKQYEDAIKQYKAGKSVAYDELPVPPGFGPLPTDSAGGNSASNSVPASDVSSPTSSASDKPLIAPSPVPPKKSTTPQKPTVQDLTTRTSGNHQKNNLAEQQMKILLERQREFKLAALEAKKSGEIEQAKEYLKIYKGFESLLNAASSGLPVDLNTVNIKNGFLNTLTYYLYFSFPCHPPKKKAWKLPLLLCLQKNVILMMILLILE